METADSSWIKAVTLGPPSLQDNTADAERLIAGLRKILETEDDIRMDISLIRRLPDTLRNSNFDVQCILHRAGNRWQLIDIREADDPSPAAGLAVDLGTSRIALRLLDLKDGRTLAESGLDNPQLAIGSDILTRIHHTESEGGLSRLNRLVLEGLNQAAADLCRSIDIEPQNIYFLALSGNTAMTHLFLGIDPRWMIREPYIPAINQPGILKAADIGMKLNPAAGVFIFPNIGSYFGGDLVAGVLYAGLHRFSDTAVLVDVGTNAEVILGNDNWLIACAGAAGPALEGGVTKMGMMAGPGVVDKITIDSQTREFYVHTIEDRAPRGICGSGVIDLAAQLYLAGMIDIRGKLVADACAHRLKMIDGMLQLIVVPADQSATGADLTVSQADLDSLVRSKAAMYTILETITLSVGMELRDLNTFYVAGTFGSFIDPRSAITIGMLPDLPLHCYRPLGNSSLNGAALVLTSADSMAEVDRIRDRITYLELNVNQDFMNRFSAAKFIPHTSAALFPSVNV